MIRRLAPAAALAALVSAALVSTAEAAPGDPIGSAVVVVDQVTAEYSRDLRTLVQGDRVRHSELITAGPAARTELALDDDTKLALGPGARLRLDKFVYNPGKSGNAILVDLLKGTFRFITGVASKPSYVIRTPAAAITVRGTIFDVFVRETGETWLLLSEGGVEICNARGKCRVLDKPGKMIRIGDNGEVGSPSCWSKFGSAPDFTFDEAFPFVVTPPSVDPAPVFTRAVLIENGVCGREPKIRRTDITPRSTKQKEARIEKTGGKPRQPKPAVKMVKVEKPAKAEPIRMPLPRRKIVRVVEVPEIADGPRPGWTIKLPHRHHDIEITKPPRTAPIKLGSFNVSRPDFNRPTFGNSKMQLR